MIVGRFIIGREDGITEATQDLATASAGHKIISLLSCNGLSEVPADTVTTSLASALPMLSEAGLVQVGLSEKPVVEGGATFEEAHAMLSDANLTLTQSVTVATGNKDLGRDGKTTFGFFRPQ